MALTAERAVKDTAPGRVDVCVGVVYGASSAITSSTGNGVTVTKVGTGETKFLFPVAYRYFKGMSHIVEGATGQAHLFPKITTNLCSTTGAVHVTWETEAGTATDPTSTETYHMVFTFDEVGLVP